MILITGAGRSGTTYMARALQRCGLDMPHERLGRDGTVSSLYCFDAPWYPGKKHAVPRPEFDVILHQARHPLNSIASIQTGKSWDWTCQFLPVGEDAPLLQRACYNWLVFNEEAEGQARYTYRIEALVNAWPTLQRLIGFEAPYSAIADLPHTINSRKHSSVTWDNVREAAPKIYDDIRAAAERYGYS